MRKNSFFYTAVLVLCILLFYTDKSRAADSTKKLHVFTVASHENSGLRHFLKSSKRYGISVDILGWGKPYPGHGQKLIYWKEYLQDKSDSDIVLYVDGFDILFQANQETILNKFLAMKAPFVIAVERICAPIKKYAQYYPESPTKFRYINCGSFIGYVSAMKKILNGLEPFQATDDDQAIVMRHYFNNRELYKFDYHCDLFLPLLLVDENEIAIDKKNRVVRSLSTNSVPCIVHGNGAGIVLLRKIWDELF